MCQENVHPGQDLQGNRMGRTFSPEGRLGHIELCFLHLSGSGGGRTFALQPDAIALLAQGI
jgi:hypothetical protein